MSKPELPVPLVSSWMANFTQVLAAARQVRRGRLAGVWQLLGSAAVGARRRFCHLSPVRICTRHQAGSCVLACSRRSPARPARTRPPHSTPLHPTLTSQAFPATHAWAYHTSLPPRHNPTTGQAEKPYLCRRYYVSQLNAAGTAVARAQGFEVVDYYQVR